MFKLKVLKLLPALMPLLFATAVEARGLLHVEQSIFGMDCAPCAFGIERGLKKLPGVAAVEVSLNDGTSVIRLEKDADTRLEQIRKVVRDNGFTPKDAVLTVSGTLAREGKQWVLDAGAAGRYQLDPALIPRGEGAGQVVTLKARAPEGSDHRLLPPDEG